MNFKPEIKILILNWNGINHLDKCLESIQQIKYDNFTTTVIDNGSTDGSCGLITEKYPEADIISIDSNLGYSKGYNYGFNKLKNDDFEYYLILNNDTIVDIYLLDNLVENIKCYGSNNIYSPKINFMESNKIWYAGGSLCKMLGITHHKWIYKTETLHRYKTSKTDYVSGCCMFIRKDIINTLKGFSEKYKMYYEDVDLCLRAKKINSDCYVIEESTILHKVSASIGKKSFHKMLIKGQSQIKFMYLHNNFVNFILGICLNIIMTPIYLLKFLYEKL